MEPPGAPQDGRAPPQPQAATQAIEGHGQVLLLGELWQDARFLTLQDILEQTLASGPAGPSSTRATSGHSSSSKGSRRCLKRPCDSSLKGTDGPAAGPAAKSKRPAQRPPIHRLQAEDLRECELEAAGGSAGAPAARAAEDRAAGCPEPPAARERAEPGARLLLVLCRASVLRSQLPRLQLLLQQVHARHRRPPAALVGIVVQPARDEEAEARRRMESLLRSAFAPRGRAVEVHTAVFSPSRPEGALDVRRAASRAHNVAARGCVPLVERGTQTDGEGPEGAGWEPQAATDVPRVGNFKYGGRPGP